MLTCTEHAQHLTGLSDSLNEYLTDYQITVGRNQQINDQLQSKIKHTGSLKHILN